MASHLLEFVENQEARSAASVRAVRTVGGAAGYLKVTPAALGAEPLAAARREFRFYEELAATIPVCTPRILNGLSDETGVALLFAAAGESRSPRLWTERVLQRAVLGEELATYLFLWPPYAALNDPAGMARVTRRTGALTELWLAF